MDIPVNQNGEAEKRKELQLVSFNLGDEEYGVDIVKVQEINRMLPVSCVPRAPEYVEGIINLRGRVIPLINLRQLFGMEKIERNKRTRIVVLDIEGAILGIVVDAVSEVLRLPIGTIEPPPAVCRKGADYMQGVGKVGGKLLILLDLSRLFKEVVEKISDIIPAEEAAH